MSTEAMVAEMVEAVASVVGQADLRGSWCPVCGSDWKREHKEWCWWPALVEAVQKREAYLAEFRK